MHKYRLISKKGEGAFSEVIKAQSIATGKFVAIKCMKTHFDSIEQVNNLREIQALRKLSPHAHVIKLLEVLYDEPTGRLALVFELMDMNLYEVIKGKRNYLPESKVKNYMYQLLKAVDHMHKNGIFHRDIKPENILIADEVVKLADFGSCRGIFSKQPYTEYISTRWYRAPECLLTDGYYSYKMDMWGFGCVMFEMMSLFPLFPGKDEPDQVHKIHNVLGTPPRELLEKFKKFSKHMDFNFPHKEGTGIAKLTQHISPEAIDLVERLLAYNPDDRLSAKQALRHPYFQDLYEQDKRTQMNTGPSSTLRGTYNEIHSDNQSENQNNISHSSNNPNLGLINININNSSSNQNMNIHLNLSKKKGLLPDIRKGNNTYQENSEDDQNNGMSGKYNLMDKKHNQLMLSKKYSKYPMIGGTDLVPGGQNYMALKKISDKKKSYISPYSQKAIITTHKPY